MTEPTKTEPTAITTDAATTATTTKPGWKTTEYWLAKIAVILGGLLASGLVTDDRWLRAFGIAAVVLTSLGYTVSRTMVKNAAVLAFVVGLASTQLGCEDARGRATAGAHAFLDCGKTAIKAQADELLPALLANVKNAIGGDGKIDRLTFSSFASPLKSAGSRCALDAAIAALLHPPAPRPDAPMSEPFPVDSADLSDAYNGLRASAWGGVDLRSSP